MKLLKIVFLLGKPIFSTLNVYFHIKKVTRSLSSLKSKIIFKNFKPVPVFKNTVFFENFVIFE